MEKYKDQQGTSGVKAYEAGGDYIKVQFLDGGIYTYTYQLPGRHHVETMKKLADKGQGLATYINQQVRSNFASKLN